MPVGTVMPSYRSARVKMIVVANEQTGIKHWRTFNRNIVDDFQAAFGEAPGKMAGVGVLTDIDNWAKPWKRGTATFACIWGTHSAKPLYRAHAAQQATARPTNCL